MVFDRRTVLAALTLLPAASMARADDSAEAAAAVKEFQDGQLGIIRKLGGMSVRQRYDALRPAIGATFDLPDMARVVFGAGWEPLDDARKAEWTVAFADYVAASYAAHLEGFNGKGFERDDKTVARDGALVVTTRIVLDKGPPMAVDYVVRKTPKGWKIGDILAEGSVSELAQWRRSLRGLSQDGFDASLKALRERTQNYLTP
jgi:phospholipid transport system substrate-binding protein